MFANGSTQGNGIATFHSLIRSTLRSRSASEPLLPSVDDPRPLSTETVTGDDEVVEASVVPMVVMDAADSISGRSVDVSTRLLLVVVVAIIATDDEDPPVEPPGLTAIDDPLCSILEQLLFFT